MRHQIKAPRLAGGLGEGQIILVGLLLDSKDV